MRDRDDEMRRYGNEERDWRSGDERRFGEGSGTGAFGHGGGESMRFEAGAGQGGRGSQGFEGGYGGYSQGYGGYGHQQQEYGQGRQGRQGFQQGWGGGQGQQQGQQGYGGYGTQQGDWYSGTSGQERGFGRDRGFGQEREGYRQLQGPYTGRGPKGYQRSDERIREDVSDKLTDHGDIDASDIEIDVNQGMVTLRGTVPDRRQKRLAEDIVESCSGVQDVTNNLKAREKGDKNLLEQVGDAISGKD